MKCHIKQASECRNRRRKRMHVTGIKPHTLWVMTNPVVEQCTKLLSHSDIYWGSLWSHLLAWGPKMQMGFPCHKSACPQSRVSWGANTLVHLWHFLSEFIWVWKCKTFGQNFTSGLSQVLPAILNITLVCCVYRIFPYTLPAQGFQFHWDPFRFA